MPDEAMPPHPLDVARAERRCPDCGLPCQWVHNPGSDFPRRPDCRAWERHQQIDRMKRAASACANAGFEQFAESIWRELDRLTSPQRSAA